MVDIHNFYNLQYDLNVNCYFVKHSGVFDYNALMTRSDAVFKHPCWMPKINSLTDFRNCKINLSPEELIKAALVVHERVRMRGKAKELLLVSDKLSFGLVRQYLSQVDTDCIERRVYSSMDGFDSSDVKEYLDIGEEYTFPTFLDL